MDRFLTRGAAIALGLSLALGPAGCVPKSKYLEVERQLNQCEKRLDKRRTGTSPTQDLISQLRPLVDRGVLEISDQDGRTVIAMRANILFPSGSAVLSADGRSTIREVAKILARRTDVEWQVEGHTDNEAIHTAEFPNNWYLGAARALAVLGVMVEAGMASEHLSAATFGEYAPIASNNNEAGRARNRRIEIVLLPEVAARRRVK